MERKLVDADLYFQNVVIGADLDAVTFAHQNKYFLIKNRSPYHHSYEDIEQEWAKKIYQLYEMALVPFVDKSNVIRVFLEEKIIKVFTDRNVYTVRYDRLHLYDDENLEGVSLNRELLHYRVIDWFDCQGLYNIENLPISTSEKFVSNIQFFLSKRIDGNQKYYDLFCESFLTEEQLKKFDYSDTMARFKIVDTLKKKGISNPRMSSWKRDIFPIYKTI